MTGWKPILHRRPDGRRSPVHLRSLRMMRYSVSSWILFWLAWAATASPVRCETRLRWKFKPGETLQFDFRQGSKTEATVAGKPTTANLEMAMRLKWSVDKVDPPGGATITQAIEKLSLTMRVDELP